MFPYLLDGVESSTMATDAGANDKQVVVERLGRASISGWRGRDRDGCRAQRSRDSYSVRIGVAERREAEGLPSEAAEAEIDRLWLNDVVWSGNGGREGRERERGLHFGNVRKRRQRSEEREIKWKEMRERERGKFVVIIMGGWRKRDEEAASNCPLRN